VLLLLVLLVLLVLVLLLLLLVLVLVLLLLLHLQRRSMGPTAACGVGAAWLGLVGRRLLFVIPGADVPDRLYLRQLQEHFRAHPSAFRPRSYWHAREPQEVGCIFAIVGCHAPRP
jgi:hypothetical protein